MTIVAIDHFNFPPVFQANGQRSSGTATFDATDEAVACIFTWNYDDAVIDKVAWKTASVGGADHTVAAEIWSVLESTDPNEPEAVISGATVNQVVSSTDDNTVYELTLGTAPTLSRGTTYAVVIRMEAFGSSTLQVRLTDNYFWPADLHAPYTMFDGGAGWNTDVSDFLAIAIGEKTTGIYRPIGNHFPPGNDGSNDGTGASVTLGQQDFNTGASKDEIGNIFQVPGSMRTSGLWVAGDFEGDVTFKLTSDPLGTPALERSYQLDLQYRPDTGDALRMLPWATDFTLSIDTDYALTVVAENAGANVLPTANCHTAAMLGAYWGGTTWIFCDRDAVAPGDSGGVFTKASPATKRAIGLGLVINGVDNGAGGGSSNIIIARKRRVI